MNDAKRLNAIGLTFVAALALQTAMGFGQDLVLVRSGDGTRTIKREGLIVEWLGNQVRMELNGRLTEIDADRIETWQTSWPEAYELARASIERREWNAATESLMSSIDAETRPWARRFLRARCVELLALLDRPEEACEQFLAILDEDPQSSFFAVIPLCWEVSPTEAPSAEIARKWIEADDFPRQLLGASWLLATTDREIALKTLEELSRDLDARIAHLASAQLWRDQLLTVRDDAIARWQRQLERMPRELRPGPDFVMGLALRQIRQSDDAVISWMKVVVLAPERLRLAALALQNAAQTLQNGNRPEDARRLWSELRNGFPGTPFAETAELSLESR
jgi:tetratricopeptide (TPR) repeat protein